MHKNNHNTEYIPKVVDALSVIRFNRLNVDSPDKRDDTHNCSIQLNWHLHSACTL